MQIAIFHKELQLFGMEIPDGYDRFSVYLEILHYHNVIGSFRIVFPNTSLGLPIEQTGFNLNEFDGYKVCEMSRLVVLKEKRGIIPFSKIISSTRKVAKEHNASIILAEILPQNVPIFKRYGFSMAGAPVLDPSVKSIYSKEPLVYPMQMYL